MRARKFYFGVRCLGCFLAVFILFLTFSLPVKADTVGQSYSFHIDKTYDIQSRTVVNATLRKVSNSADFYVEDSYWNSVSTDTQSQTLIQINFLAQEFDTRIYPIETQFFGVIKNSGDGRVAILLSPLLASAGGYYDTINEYTRQQAPTSNEREMVYLNVSQLSDQRRVETFLAHELQHVITFNQKNIIQNVSDDVWLNELRSEYAVTLLGYNDPFPSSNLEHRLGAFFGNPEDSLTEWKNLSPDYGQIALFGEYIAEHWSPKVIADTLKNQLIGIPSLEDALSKNGFMDSFKDVFTDWVIANILNDTSVNPRFGYNIDGLRNFRVNPTKVLNNLTDDFTFVVSDSITDWSGRWYDVSQFGAGKNNFLRIKFSSLSLASFYVPYVVFKSDGTKAVSVFNPDNNSSTLYLGQIGQDLNRVIFMPIKKDKIAGFTANETPTDLSFAVDRVASSSQMAVITPLPSPIVVITPVPTVTPVVSPVYVPTLPDGSLVRAAGDYKVYLIMGKWRRHIVNGKIFNFYKQFGFDKVREIDPSVLAQYQESNLVRYDSNTKVYVVDESGVKHWLNISYKQFIFSGRSANSIFPINLSEFNFYRTGLNITK